MTGLVVTRLVRRSAASQFAAALSLAAALCLTAAGCTSDDDAGGGITISPAEARPGERLSLTFEDESQRGVGFVMARQVDGEWREEYLLIADATDPRTDARWSALDEPGLFIPALGTSGPGPDEVIVPDVAAAGDYRICEEDEDRPLCGFVTVAEDG